MSFNRNFNNQTSFSTFQYEEFKKVCNETQPIIKSINIGSLNLLNSKTVEITQVRDEARQSAIFEITDNAFKQLMKVLGLTYGTFDTFINTLGSEATAMILEALREKLKKEPAKNKISIVVSKTTGKIVDIIKYNGQTLENETFFAIVETALNGFENAGMSVKNMSVSEEGNISITILNKNWTFNIEGMQSNLKDEYFNSGMTIIKTNNRIIINPFNERLVCKNGMVDTLNGHAIVLNSTNPKDVEVFFEKAKDFGKGRGSFEMEFKQRVIKMLSTNASFSELLKAYDTVNYMLNSSHERSRLQLSADFHIHDINAEFMKRYNINLFEQNQKFKSKIITDYNMWDLVNKLTWIASNPHKHEYDFTNGNDTVFQLQKVAGEFTFKEHFDLGLSVPQIFEADAAMTNAEIIAKIKRGMNI